jgi:hypothetical protein
MVHRLRLTLLFGVLLGFMFNIPFTAAAPCIIDAGSVGIDQLFTCPGADGVNVGSGNDTVNIIGPVTGMIESSGGSLNIFILEPDGSLIVPNNVAIFMNGTGNVTSIGDITSNLIGIYITGGTGDVTSTGNIMGGAIGIATDSGNVTSIGDLYGHLYGIYIGGDGSVTSTGDVIGAILNPNVTVSGDRHGIYIGGSGDVTSTGDITSGTYGIYIGGSGNVTSIGDVTGGGDGEGTGIRVIGSGNVTSTGDVTGGEYGIFIGGSGNVISTGAVIGGGTGEGTGILVGLDGNVTNSGIVGGGNYGIHIIGSGNVDSNGLVIGGESGIRIEGSGNVTTDGTVYGGEAFGIYVGGNGNVTNFGSVTGINTGIYVSGNGNVTSTGTVAGGNDGISVGGDGEINVHSVLGNVGIRGGDGDQIVVIDAVVIGTGGTAVDLGGGADRVNLRNGVDIVGDIRMGIGDDTVQISSGARVYGLEGDDLIEGGGTIDGGDDTDTLIVGDETLCKEASGALDRYTGTSALLNSINLSGDTFTFDGNSYTIEDFEIGENGITRRTCVPRIEDGRTNAYDIGAWIALYCNTLDGVNLWAIDLEGNGQVDISVDGATMRTALQQAVDTSSDVLVASGPRGTTLWALSWNQYRAVRPDQREPGKNYEYTFAPGTCGMGNALS